MKTLALFLLSVPALAGALFLVSPQPKPKLPNKECFIARTAELHHYCPGTDFQSNAYGVFLDRECLLDWVENVYAPRPAYVFLSGSDSTFDGYNQSAICWYNR